MLCSTLGNENSDAGHKMFTQAVFGPQAAGFPPLMVDGSKLVVVLVHFCAKFQNCHCCFWIQLLVESVLHCNYLWSNVYCLCPT